jgi:hypothetical protein
MLLLLLLLLSCGPLWWHILLLLLLGCGPLWWRKLLLLWLSRDAVAQPVQADATCSWSPICKES